MNQVGSGEERFACLERGEGYRLGIYCDPVSAGSGERLEVLLRLLQPGKPLDPVTLVDMAGRLRALAAEGYVIEAEVGGWAVCTRPLSPEKKERERQLAVARAALPTGWIN